MAFAVAAKLTLATVGNDIVVSNTRGIDARRPNNPAGHGTHDTTSSLTRFTLPDDSRSGFASMFLVSQYKPVPWTTSSSATTPPATATGRSTPVQGSAGAGPRVRSG
ncbi:hypothetical protein ACFY20_45565 [Streptomyces sp. NPDC001312]|uniref:hypothetical protein n=1 Tax=Streptomyces sp. NPDC001312 TaxID=3364561 RepID=UPI0036924E3C